MSFKGILEFVVNLQSYYIIEYPQQGLFSFHFRIYQANQHKKNYAIPYQLIPRPQQAQNPRIIVQGSFDDATVHSSTGLAKYSQQEIELDDWFQLRLQVEGYPELKCEEVYLQVEFRFNHKNMQDPDVLGDLIQTCVYKINDLENGMFSYCQAEFDSPFYSKLKFTMMGYLTSFKFAKYEPLAKELDGLDRKRVKVHSAEELLNLTKEEYPKENIEALFYVNYIKKLRISQYLIAEKINSLRHDRQDLKIMVDTGFLLAFNYQTIKEKEFKQYLDKYIPNQLSISSILKELNLVRQQNFDFLQLTIHQWIQSKIDVQACRKEFLQYQKELYGERVFKSVIHGRQEITSKKQISSRENKKIAKEIRGKNISLNNYAIEDVRIEREKDKQEIIFYELIFPFQNKIEQKSMLKLTPQDSQILKEGCKLQYSQKHMLVVLCHGFQGSSYDMLLIKRWIMQQLPQAYYLVSKSNEDSTEGDIRIMGKKVAQEIENYISNYMEEYQQENVIINLVGHSMGGIIARAAIPHLKKYQHQFGFFCSLSSPHLGYLNGVSGLIKVGLWAIRRWKKIDSLQQLSMQQRGDPRKTFLYELSQSGHLRYFRKIILLSSFQDSYVSWNSARISSYKSKNSHAKVEQEMQANILGGNIYGATIHRFDINFNVKTNDLDSFIGRTAHINLIIRENLFKALGITVPSLFDLVEFGRQGLFL